MNDPGLQDPIAEAAAESKNSQYDGYESEEEEERELFESSRWWFAATACPLLAGTFGPMASGFNICALVSSWREEFTGTEDSGNVVHDPTWLIAINAVSLACALIANIALLSNMSGRASFAIAQPITCVGFALAAVILIVLVSLASSSIFRLQPQEADHALTQAFYYAIWAAGIYTIITILMTLTVVGAIMGKYPKEFNLSKSQRTLMLQTISFMAYLLIGALIYCKIEGWSYLDALFFADYTLLTIGIGAPFTPETHVGRGLLFPFAIGGVISIGLIIGSIRAMILEQGKEKMHARATEKKRERVYSIKEQKHGHYSTKWRKQEKYLVEAGIPPEARRRKEFHAMREVQENARKQSQWVSLAASTFAACVLWFVGALVFKNTEYKQGWSYFVSLYFSYTSLTTIGYGDFTPMSNCGKSFFVLWSILAIPTLTILISDMGDTVVKGIADATNFLGTLTILPGEKHAYSSLKARINMVSKGRVFKDSPPPQNSGDNTGETHRTGSVSDLVATRLADEELFVRHEDFYPQLRQLSKEDNEPAFQEAIAFDPDVHFYRFLLVKETRNLLLDMSAAKTKKYTYDEWAYFLRLLGHDESNPQKPMQPTPIPRPDGARTKSQTKEDPPPEIGRIVDSDGNLRAWSWLSIRSPLMSRKEESEWILHALLARLQRELMHLPNQPGSDHSSPSTSQTSLSPSTASSSAAARGTTITQPPPPPVRLSEIRTRLRARNEEDAPHRSASGAEMPDDASQTERRGFRRRRSDEEGRDADAAGTTTGSGQGNNSYAFPLLEAIQDRAAKSEGNAGTGRRERGGRIRGGYL